MSFRFRKSKSLEGGARLNLGKRSGSMSFGVKGARLSVGSRGLRGTAGIPGSGISYSRNLGATGRGGRPAPAHASVGQVLWSLLILAAVGVGACYWLDPVLGWVAGSLAVVFIGLLCVASLSGSPDSRDGGFRTLNWDDFWQKRLQMSFQESTQTALDSYEIGVADSEDQARLAIEWLQSSHPQCLFAAWELSDTWMLLGRTGGNRPISEKKRHSLEESLAEWLSETGEQ